MDDPCIWGKIHWRFVNGYEPAHDGIYDAADDIYRVYPVGCPWEIGAEMANDNGSCVKMWFEYGKDFHVLYEDKNLLWAYNLDALLRKLAPIPLQELCR